IGASEDGSVAYFVAEARLIDGAPPGDADKIYRWAYNAGSPTLEYIGTLANEEPLGGLRKNGLAVAERANYRVREARVSADGSHLLVHTIVPLDPAVDRDIDRDVYLWGVGEGWKCVSCQMPAVPSDGDVWINPMFGPPADHPTLGQPLPVIEGNQAQRSM